MVSEQSQDETEQQPTIGRIPGLIAAVAIVGIAIGDTLVELLQIRSDLIRIVCLPELEVGATL